MSIAMKENMVATDVRKLSLKELENICLNSALHSWSQRSGDCPEAPQLIYLCPTNVCNHRCVTCGYGAMRKGKKADGTPQRGYMDMDLYRKIISELPRGFRRLYLQKTGESLLHPQIGEMMRILKQERPEYERAIHTNASVLTPELADALIKNMSFVSLSIFATDRETFKLAHGADHFDRVMRNIAMFHEAWMRAENPPKVYFDVVRNIYNMDQSDNSIFDFLQGHFPKFNTGIHFPYNFQGFVKEYDNDIFSKIDPQRMPTCIHPWDMMAIYWDGAVGYCVGDPLEKANLGNLNEQTVMEVWNGEKYQEFRRLLVEKDYKTLREMGIHCGSCNWNFALKSQVLTSLCMHRRGRNPEKAMAPGKHLYRGEDMLRAALASYACGDVPEALKNAAFAEIVAKDPEIREKARQWKDKVLDILTMRKDLEYWQGMLEEEGLSLGNVHISKYRLSAEQQELTGVNHSVDPEGNVVKRDNF